MLLTTSVTGAGPQDKASVQKKLEGAVFIGKGDRKVVLDMYKRFQLDVAQAQRLCTLYVVIYLMLGVVQVSE